MLQIKCKIVSWMINIVDCVQNMKEVHVLLLYTNVFDSVLKKIRFFL